MALPTLTSEEITKLEDQYFQWIEVASTFTDLDHSPMAMSLFIMARFNLPSIEGTNQIWEQFQTI